MELIYIYIKNYRTFQEQKIHLTDKFQVTLDDTGVKIVKKETYCKMFQDNISNINVIVGKNASGKTSLMELVGNRVDNRYVLGEQLPLTVETPADSLYFTMNKKFDKTFGLVTEYFFLYHDKIGNFILEGNHCENMEKLLGYKSVEREDDTKSLWGMYHFHLDQSGNPADACFYQNKGGSSQEDTIIFLVKNQFSEKKTEGVERHPMVPRREINLKGFSWERKMNFLIETMKNNDSELYRSKEYQLNCDFSEHLGYSLDGSLESLFLIRSTAYDFLKEKPLDEQFLLAYLYHYYYYLVNSEGSSVDQTTKKNDFFEASLKESAYNYPELREEMKEKTLELMKQRIPVNYLDTASERFKNAIHSLVTFFEKVTMHGSGKSDIGIEYRIDNLILYIFINKESKIEGIHDLFEYILDDRLFCEIEKESVVSAAFVSPRVEYLSDGEQANLSLFTAIDEQITTFAPDKKHYIILLDEVEKSMHPEMCRTFLNDLMKFLKNYPDKTFQIIISSHSPFLISDLPQSSVIRLEKKEEKTTVLLATERTFGQNIHTILKSDFFLEQTSGEYANRLVKEIANYLRSGSKQSAEDFLAENFNISLESGKGKDFISYVIGEIGEPILRSALEKMYQKWSGNSATLEERISKLEAELEMLKQKVE
ncbi:MAG: AAA family ATPase [Eubacteriales bacterium]